jgi:O-antigen/teichoic acid export membrane protein
MTSLTTIGRNTVFSAGGDLISKIASLAFYVVMARELGRTGFGHYMFSLSLTVLLTSLAGFGTDALLTRSVARDRAALHDLFFNSIGLKVVMGAGLGAAAVLISVANGYGGSVHVTTAVLAVAAISDQVAKTFAATFLAYDDVRPSAAGLILQRFVTAAAGIAALVAGAGIVPVAVIYLGGSLLGLAYVTRALIRREIRPRRELSVPRARAVAKESVPFGLKLVFSTAIFRIDSTILSLMKGGAAVGLYSAAYRALESTLFVVYGFEAALFPTFSRLRRDSEPPVGSIYAVALKAVLALMTPIGLVFLVYSGPILRLLYGHDYGAAATAMAWLGGAAALYGVSFISSSLVVAQGAARQVAWATGIIMVENVVLNVIVIPHYSLNGAAAVTTITEITQAIVLGTLALRFTGAVPVARILAAPLAGAAAMAAIGLAAPRTVPLAIVALAAYALAALAAERALFPADLARLTGGLRHRLRHG